MLVACGFQRLLTHLNKKTLKYVTLLLMGLTIVFSSARLVLRNRVWSSRETLFR